MTPQSSPHIRKRLAELLVMAAAYYVVGRLGLLLAIPPGYATAVWPASGIALAGTLLFGYRVWPGTLLGSFSVNVWTSLDTTSTASIVNSILLATSIGMGASLQAVAGAFLVRRLVGYPTPFVVEHDVIRFLILGGPVSCLVSSTFGVTSLLLGGVIEWADYPFHWWTWWTGDTIGVITFAPLVVIWTAKPAHVSLRRRIAISAPLCLAFALVVTFFAFTNSWEHDRTKLEFGRRTDNLAQTLRGDFESHLELLHSIESFYAGSVDVDRQEFKQFVSRVLSRNPGIQALSWNPRVLDRERKAYEEAARRDGFRDFQITEQNPQGQLDRAAHRAEYVTVYYIEPYAGNEEALGFDVASDPIRRKALDRARDTGEPTATDRIILVQETRRRVGLLVFLPIYRHGLSFNTVEERRRNLQGYATGVFRVGDMIQASLKGVETKGLQIRLYDTTAPERDRLLYDHRSQRHESTDLSTEAGEVMNPSVLQRVIPFDMAGRRWALQFALTQEYLVTQRSWQAWSVLAGGLLFTGLLGAFLLVVTGRTVQLQAVNRELRREVTERRQAEEALHKSEGRKGAILESALDGIITIDHEGKIVEVNPAAEKMFGYSRIEAVGKPMAELMIPPHLRENHRHGLTQYLANGEGAVLGKRIEMPALRADGTEFPVELSVTRIGQEGPPMFTGYVRDITERKRAEEIRQKNQEYYESLQQAYEELSRTQAQLVQSQKMEAVGQLAGGIAHDFNNLLTVIRGRGHLLLNALRPDNPLRRHMEIIDRTADRAARLTQQLLAFSRKQVLQPRVLDLNEVIAGTGELLRRLIGEDIQLVAEREPMLGPILADPIQIEQVIVNLAVNARDAMPDGGKLIFRTRAVPLDAEAIREYQGMRPGRYVMLQVADTGRGMDAATRARVFEPFFTTKGPGKGTGLGLATVYGIVKQSGGFIYLESEPGQGTTFTMYFPRADTAAAVPEEPTRGAVMTSGAETVLLVEDDAEVRELAQEILEAQGYTVLAAGEPHEALRVLETRQTPVDLLLTDVVMPGTSGRVLAEKVKTICPGVSVLYMSGYTDDAMVHHGVLESGTRLLPKPFTPETLAGTVREVLDASSSEAG